MNRFEFDWNFVRRYTLMPFVTAVAAALLLGTGMWVHGEQEVLHEQLSVNQDALHEDYDELVYRRRLVDRYHRRYEQFYELGFVGEESRLDWIETLREASLDLTLPRVSYAIEPQLQVVAPVESILASDDLQIHLSRLKLEVGLVHEIDLMRFFDELQRNAPGLIKVDQCTLAWQAEDVGALKVGANILADCSIMIFSVVTSDVSGRTTS